MTYLTLALWAEGLTDRPFLCPLLRRVVIEHALRGQQTIDVAEEYISLPDPGPDKSRAERISDAVAMREGEIALLFIHSDGKGRREQARDQSVKPAIEKIASLPSPPYCIAVVPIHETEAWILADGAALAKALGVNILKLAGLPQLNAIERHPDPKQCLNDIRRAARRKSRVPLSLDRQQIAENVDLVQLRRLPAFCEVEVELEAAMRHLRLL